MRELDDRPLGADLTASVWRKLRTEAEGGGLLYAHKEYCGHGLVRHGQGIDLAVIEDGWPRDILRRFEDEASFVAFFERLSDRALAGADPAEPLFYTADDWARGNQRLSRARMSAYVEGRPEV